MSLEEDYLMAKVQELEERVAKLEQQHADMAEHLAEKPPVRKTARRVT